MPIKFLNIRSKEVRIAESEPQISALWSSSDRSPNITQGQDFGWRLAKEVVLEMRKIQQDPVLIQQIAARYQVSYTEVDEKKILEYISDKTSAEDAPVANFNDYEDEYRAEVRKAELDAREAEIKSSETATTTTKK